MTDRKETDVKEIRRVLLAAGYSDVEVAQQNNCCIHVCVADLSFSGLSAHARHDKVCSVLRRELEESVHLNINVLRTISPDDAVEVLGSPLTRDEISQLLYLETRVVDHLGLIDARQMNSTDFEISQRWNEQGFIHFGRVSFNSIKHNLTHWVKFTEDAWDAAHKARRLRGHRGWLNRDYITVEAKN